MISATIRFAIIGTGVAGRYHATAIAQTPNARLVAVCRASANQADRATTEQQFGVSYERDYADLLARRDVDVVCICTPSGLHAQQALAAANAGKHVLVEKPMALTLSDADAVMAACQRNDVLLGVVLQRRTDPVFRQVRDAITQGELGRLTLGNVVVPYLRPQNYYDSAAWRGTVALDGGGVLMNQGIHLVDLLLWFMGAVVSVQAHSDTLMHDIEVEDCLTATLRFANGALGSIVATTTAAPGFPHRVEVYGTEGGVQIEGEQIVRWENTNNAPKPNVTKAANIAAGAGATPTGISAAGHTRIIADFVSALREGHVGAGLPHPYIVSGAEGRRSLALVLAVYEAAKTGKTVSHLEDPKGFRVACL
jgi:predicted dehydrogenase